jgi:hypothetical protein
MAWSASWKSMFEIKMGGSTDPRFAGAKIAEDDQFGGEK